MFGLKSINVELMMNNLLALQLLQLAKDHFDHYKTKAIMSTFVNSKQAHCYFSCYKLHFPQMLNECILEYFQHCE